MYYTTVTTTPLSRPQVKINLSDLSNCGVITTSSLITFIQSLLVVLDEEHSTQMRKDSYLFLVLTALPWCGRTVEKNQSVQLNQIMEKIDIYISSRDKTHNDILRVWRTDTPLPQEDMIESCWKQVSNMAKAIWFDLLSLK
jgi:nuclear cap-binding protein subunit 1